MSDKQSEPVLTIDGLSVTFDTNQGPVEAVKGISMQVKRGETVAVVGESGSGKSQTMMAAMGLLADNGRTEGAARYRDKNLIGMSQRALNEIRGGKVTMIFQEPMTSLDPLYTIGRQIAEPIVQHAGMNWRDAKAKALELLKLVQIPDPERRMKAYPHEMSGGQRQRVMIAMALANDPDVLIADEPTTALDVTTQANILELLAELQERLGMAIMFITHDLGIVRRIADRVYVMKTGEVVEEGRTAEIFDKPSHPYTKMLLDAEPEGDKPPVDIKQPILLQGRSVNVEFLLDSGFLTKKHVLTAVNQVNVTLREGQTLGVVGESGSGKSTLGRALLRLLPSTGQIRFEGSDLRNVEGGDLRAIRREMQLIFQDPFGSLSPRMTVGEIVTEGLLVHEPSLSSGERDRRACAALEEVA
ncbi:MAG: ATP-binding cassette domain-containing protein, partial [Stappiaceae bacterium]